jgi:predicted nuclease of predicted toxin-antitoxin system
LVDGWRRECVRREKPSVVQIRADDVTREPAARYVVDALQQTAAGLRSGALPTIDQAGCESEPCRSQIGKDELAP